MSTRAAEWLARGIQPEWTLTVVASIQDESGDGRPLAELDDRGLVDACRAGRVGAFDVIVERHQRAVYALCYRFVRTHEDASDLSQEVFLRAFRGLRRFRGDSTLSTWLYRIGVNACLNTVSGRRAPETSLEDAPQFAAAVADPSATMIQAEQGARVRSAVARLPRKQRATLILRVYHELSHQEIATVLGTSVGAVKANFFHALGNLKKLLAAEARYAP